MNSTCAPEMSCLNCSIALLTRNESQCSLAHEHGAAEANNEGQKEKPAHFLALSGLRPVMITCAPCCSSLCAVQKPMPAATC